MIPWLRALFISNGKVVEHRDPSELLHIYLSAWEVLLYVSRLDEAVGSRTRLELERFLEGLSDDVLEQLPTTIGDGLRRLSGWLRRFGAMAQAEETAERAERAEERQRRNSTGGGFHVPSLDTWGYAGGTEYFLRRAPLLQPAIVVSVEGYFGV